MTEDSFEQYLAYWEIPLLESYIEKLEEAFGNELSEIPIERNFINVLLRAYPQCILVLKEVLCLITNGYPDGALARARRIYESMIIAMYMNLHKLDDDFQDVIERYFDDQNIRAYDGRKKYYLSINQNDMAESCDRAIADIVRKHAGTKKVRDKKKEVLSSNYWWAQNSAISFSRLSQCLEDDYAKILYTRACIAIHAGAMGDAALLGRPKSEGVCLYTGATLNGASLPLQLAVYSFARITEIVFENFGVASPVPEEAFVALLHKYFQNSAEEIVAENFEETIV